MNQKVYFPAAVMLLAVLLIAVFWKHTFLLSLLLLFLSFVKHRVYPVKYEFFWYIAVTLISGITEILLVNFIHAWNYSVTDLFGIPLFMPLFWGLLGCSIIAVYNGLISKT